MNHFARFRRALLGAGACLAGLTVALASHAGPERDPVAAESLFKTALGLLEHGDWSGACAKFQASQELDPAVSTLIKLAKCREHEGKLAEAWYTLQQALKLNRDKPDQSQKRRDELETFARAQVAALEPRVPRLRIVVRGAPSHVRVTRDGKEQPVSVLGEALPVDPGSHEAIAEARGFVAERRSVTVAEGETTDIVIELAPESAPAPAASAPAGPAVSQPLEAAGDAGSAPTGSGRRTAGFVVGGVGVAGIAAGGVLGALTLSKASGAAEDASGNAERDSARAMQAAAFVTAGVGLAALGAGIALVLTAPKRSAPARSTAATALGMGPGSLALAGTW